MMINTDGIIIRMSCENISVLSRVTSGVKLMRLDGEDIVVSIAKVRESFPKDGNGEEPEENDSTEDASGENEPAEDTEPDTNTGVNE